MAAAGEVAAVGVRVVGGGDSVGSPRREHPSQLALRRGGVESPQGAAVAAGVRIWSVMHVGGVVVHV